MNIKAFIILVIGLFSAGCGGEAVLPTFETVHINLDSGEVSRPTVAVSPDGKAVFWTWIRKDSDGWNVYVSRLSDDGLTRMEPVRVNHTDGNANPHAQAPAQISMGADGNVYVAWTNSTYISGRRFPASDLLFSRSTDGGHTWTAEQAINSDAGGEPSGHTFHNMIALADGTLLVSWIDSRERDRADGAVSTSASDMNHASESASGQESAHMHEMRHEAAMTANGRPIGSQIRVARSTDGGVSFVETAIVDHTACPCCRTNLAVSSDGVVYLTWRHEFENGARDPVVARSDDGGLTFTSPVRVSNDNWVIEACPHAGPGLSADADGSVTVSWYTAADSGIGLFQAQSLDGGKSFQPRELLIGDQPVSHTAHAHMDSGVSGLAVEQVNPRSIEVFTVLDHVDSRQLIGSYPGKSPSFAGASGVSAMSYSDDEGISSVIWRAN